MGQGRGSQEEEDPFFARKKEPAYQQAPFGRDVKLYPALILDEVGYHWNRKHLTLISQIGPIEENQP